MAGAVAIGACFNGASSPIKWIINFKGDIGYSDLCVKIDGNTHMKIILEVLPSKIDYKEDYEAILKDVNEEIYNLAYGFLSRTYLGTEINQRRSNSYTEFYSILNYVYENLMKAINIVLSKPHHELVKHRRVCKYQNLKNTSMDTIKWLEKRPHLLKNIDGRCIPTEVLQVTKKVILGTRENRFLKFMLIKIIEKIDRFIKTYTETPWKKNEDIINKLSGMKKSIASESSMSSLGTLGRKNFHPGFQAQQGLASTPKADRKVSKCKLRRSWTDMELQK